MLMVVIKIKKLHLVVTNRTDEGIVTERKKTAWFLYRFTPLMSPYTGYFLRIARLSAHLQEIFFRTSYKDTWNPEKTSRYAQLEGI